MGCDVSNQTLNPNNSQSIPNIKRSSFRNLTSFPSSLKDYSYKSINQFTFTITNYYKNQQPPSDNSFPFIDPLFPPSTSSITGQLDLYTYTDPYPSRRFKSSQLFNIDISNIKWQRPKDIFNNQPFSLFDGKIKASDSIQGRIGDCYFLSAISALAEHPQMVYQIFKTLTIVDNGCYEIALRLNGEWKIVIVDDYFPCSSKTNLPIFCKPNANEIWAMLLEKAWAKVNGGYINIDAGFTIEVLSTLTPFPTEMVYHNELSKEDLWKMIYESNNNEHILTCITKCDEDIEKHGLVPGHSCTLVSAVEKNVKGNVMKLLKIRNPWGYEESSRKDRNYSGIESNGEIMNQLSNSDCKYKGKEDGMFWMEFDEYVKFFEETEICKTKQSLCVKNVKINKQRVKYANVFHLVIKQYTNVDIMLIRKSYRFNRKILPNEEVISNLILLKISKGNNNNNQLSLIKSNSSSRKNCMISQTLDKGEYIIYCHVDYEKGTYDKIRKYYIDIACDQYFDLYDKGVDKKFKVLKKIIQSSIEIKSECLNKSCRHIVEDISSCFEDTTYGYLYLKNISEKPHRIHIMPHLTNLYFIDTQYQNANDNANIEFVLHKNDAFILITNTINFYKNTEISLDYEKLI